MPKFIVERIETTTAIYRFDCLRCDIPDKIKEIESSDNEGNPIIYPNMSKDNKTYNLFQLNEEDNNVYEKKYALNNPEEMNRFIEKENERRGKK